MNKIGKNIQKQLNKLKNAKNKTEENKYFKLLKKFLSHHYKAQHYITKDINYRDMNKDVYKIFLAGIKSTRGNYISNEALLYQVRGIQQELEVEDIEQTLDLILWQLIVSYTYEKTSFFQYVTFLMPRRFGAFIWGISKDATNQFYNLQLDSYDNYEERFELKNMFETKDQYRFSSLFNKRDFELFLDIIENIEDDDLIKKYSFLNYDELIFHKERIATILANQIVQKILD